VNAIKDSSLLDASSTSTFMGLIDERTEGCVTISMVGVLNDSEHPSIESCHWTERAENA